MLLAKKEKEDWMEKPCKLTNNVKTREADWMEGFVTDPRCVTHNMRRALMFLFDIQCHLFNLIFLKCGKEQMMNSIEHHYSLQYNNTLLQHTHTHFSVAHTCWHKGQYRRTPCWEPTEGGGGKKSNLFLAVPGHQQLEQELISQTAMLLYEK